MRVKTLVAVAALAGVFWLAHPAGADTPDTSTPAEATLTIPKAIVLGVVEGLTEFVPVSSTGHLMVAERAMDIGQHPSDKTAADSYAVVIQIGAILAVALIYRRRIGQILVGLLGRDDEGRHVGLSLGVALLPALVAGFLLNDAIKAHLFGAWPVVLAWVLGGIAILAVSRLPRFRPGAGGRPICSVTFTDALLIGLAQCLAMWPGTSRSLVALLAGLALGLEMAAAIEFAFLLGLLTLGAATVFELAHDGGAVVDAYGLLNPVIGVVVSFIAGWAAVRWMLDYLRKHDLAIFGWYRIGLAVVVGTLLVTSVI
jgi:undecaprenyl-diphosphatase